MKRRPSLTNAIDWIAYNDNDSLVADSDLQEIAEQVTVVLIADLFGVHEIDIARRVLEFRQTSAKARTLRQQQKAGKGS